MGMNQPCKGECGTWGPNEETWDLSGQVIQLSHEIYVREHVPFVFSALGFSQGPPMKFRQPFVDIVVSGGKGLRVF